MNLIANYYAGLFFEDQRLAGLENDLSKRLSKDGKEALKSLDRLWNSKKKRFWDDLPEALYCWLNISMSFSEISQIWEIKKQRAAIQSYLYPQLTPNQRTVIRLLSATTENSIEQRRQPVTKRRTRTVRRITRTVRNRH